MSMYDARVLSGDGGEASVQVDYQPVGQCMNHPVVKLTCVDPVSGQSIELEIGDHDFQKIVDELNAARSARVDLLAAAVRTSRQRKACTA